MVAPEAGRVMEIVGDVGGAALFTVTESAALVVVCAAALLAAAVIEWLALLRVVGLSAKLNGALVTAAPVLLPSTLNCTLVVFADTLVVTVTVPDTVAPEAGAVIEIVGGVGGAVLFTVTESAALVVVCAAALLAAAVIEWLALLRVVVLSAKLNGALVTAAPVLFPSTLNCTLVVFADTLVVTVTVPVTVAPEAGPVMEIVGGVGGAVLFTVTESAALVVVCAAALLAAAVIEWLALLR